MNSAVLASEFCGIRHATARKILSNAYVRPVSCSCVKFCHHGGGCSISLRRCWVVRRQELHHLFSPKRWIHYQTAVLELAGVTGIIAKPADSLVCALTRTVDVAARRLCTKCIHHQPDVSKYINSA